MKTAAPMRPILTVLLVFTTHTSALSSLDRRAFGALVGTTLAPPPWTPTALPWLTIPEAARQAALPFARYPDPVLRRAGARVDAFDGALARTVALLRRAGAAHGAAGLAAPQCGVDAAVVVLGGRAFVNPEVRWRSDEADLRCWREKCLALPPDVQVETLRDRAIVVAAADAAGRRFEATLRGGAARQFLHELDHARGTLIVDHALDVAGSALYPGMAALEAPDHDERRRRAWARGDVG